MKVSFGSKLNDVSSSGYSPKRAINYINNKNFFSYIPYGDFGRDIYKNQGSFFKESKA